MFSSELGLLGTGIISEGSSSNCREFSCDTNVLGKEDLEPHSKEKQEIIEQNQLPISIIFFMNLGLLIFLRLVKYTYFYSLRKPLESEIFIELPRQFHIL